MIEYRVITARKAEIGNPVTVKKGDNVICIEESDETGDWAGWVYCQSTDSSGWIPRQIIHRNGVHGMIQEDYDAKEFDIEVDEIIIMEKMLNGWIWGYKKENPQIKAWVPLNHIECIPSAAT